MRYADRAAKIDEEMRMVLSLAPVEQIMFRKQKKVKLNNQYAVLKIQYVKY